MVEIAAITEAFALAASRALAAGFDVLEIHAAHGYLLHESFSRRSATGGTTPTADRSSTARMAREVVVAVRRVWPERLPLLIRISATNWSDGGWDVEQSVELVRQLAPLGVDMIDVSSGGNAATAAIPVGPGYQTGFAERIRRETGVATGSVGMIIEPAQADHIIRSGQADMIFLARQLLRDPYWPLRAAESLQAVTSWPAPYLRAAPRGSTRRPALPPSGGRP